MLILKEEATKRCSFKRPLKNYAKFYMQIEMGSSAIKY